MMINAMCSQAQKLERKGLQDSINVLDSRHTNALILQAEESERKGLQEAARASLESDCFLRDALQVRELV